MTEEMTGLRKAAVLLTQLGKESAAKLLSTMSEVEVEELTAASTSARAAWTSPATC
jgi:flagellar motor switch protein FliG